MSRVIDEKIANQLMYSTIPPYGLISVYAGMYQRGDVSIQEKFMRNIVGVVQSSIHEAPKLDSWGKLNAFFKETVMEAYAKHRERSQVHIEGIALTGRMSTPFDPNGDRVKANFMTALHLYHQRDISVTAVEFIQRCDKYFEFDIEEQLAEVGVVLKDLKDVIAATVTQDGVKLHVLAMMNEDLQKQLINILLKIIYQTDPRAPEDRKRRINAVFALAFLYGSKPHCIITGNGQKSSGGAFAADFMLQFLLASIGEKPIRKNYLTLTEVELLFLFGQDSREAWNKPTALYLQAADYNKTNALFHQGDTLSLLKTLISDNNLMMIVGDPYVGRKFGPVVITMLTELLLEFYQFFPEKVAELNLIFENTSSITSRIEKLKMLIESLQVAFTESVDDQFEKICAMLSEPDVSSLTSMLENRSNCREEILLRLHLAHVVAEDSEKDRIKNCISLLSPDFSDVSNGSGATCLFFAVKIGDLQAVEKVLESGVNMREAEVCGMTPLYLAVKYGHHGIVERLLKNGGGGGKNAKDINGETPLYTAIKNDRLDIVKMLFEKGPALDVSVRNKRGETPLFFATNLGRSEIVKLLLEKGVNVNQPDNQGLTPLFIASYRGHYDTVKILLENSEAAHLNINKCEKGGQTPLFIAARLGKHEIVDLLLVYGANVNEVTNERATPLLAASQFGHVEIVKALLKKDAKVDEAMRNGITPLLVAIKYGHVEIVKALLENGADSNKADNLGLVPLELALEAGNLEVVKALLEKGVEVNRRLRTAKAPLYMAIEKGDPDIVAVLLERGAKLHIDMTPLILAVEKGSRNVVAKMLQNKVDINAQMSCGTTALHMAISRGNVDAVDALLKHDAKIDIPLTDQTTPLHTAVSLCNADLVDKLIQAGANVNAKNINHITPLYLALGKIKSNVTDRVGAGFRIFELLLTKDVNVNAKSHRGVTPLLFAIQNCRNDIVEGLLKKGADVNDPLPGGQTPLHLAVQLGRSNVVNMLLERGAEVGGLAQNGVTAFHVALGKLKIPARNVADLAIFNVLLERGVNVNEPVSSGETPLIFAVKNCSNEIVGKLLGKGADVNHALCNGMTALHHAVSLGRHDVVKALLEKGAKVDVSISNGMTPLFLAVAYRRQEMFDDFLNVIKEEGWKISKSSFFVDSFEDKILCPVKIERDIFNLGVNKERGDAFQKLLAEKKLEFPIANFTILHLAILLEEHKVVQKLLDSVDKASFDKAGCPITVDELEAALGLGQKAAQRSSEKPNADTSPGVAGT